MPKEHIVEKSRYHLLELYNICSENIYAYLYFDFLSRKPLNVTKYVAKLFEFIVILNNI